MRDRPYVQAAGNDAANHAVPWMGLTKMCIVRLHDLVLSCQTSCVEPCTKQHTLYS